MHYTKNLPLSEIRASSTLSWDKWQAWISSNPADLKKKNLNSCEPIHMKCTSKLKWLLIRFHT